MQGALHCPLETLLMPIYSATLPGTQPGTGKGDRRTEGTWFDLAGRSKHSRMPDADLSHEAYDWQLSFISKEQ